MRFNLFALVVSAAFLSINCGGSYKSSPTGPTPTSGGDDAEKPTLSVADAALPFKILTRDGRELSRAQLVTAIGASRAICVGEQHPNPHDHWAQLQIWEMLARDGGQLALGMEMFQRPFQGVLDDYTSGVIDIPGLLSRSDWENRWGYDFALYQPMIELAAERKLTLLALNMEKEIIKKVSREGIDNLADSDRAKLPEVNLDDDQHRAWWAAIMGAMGGAHGHGGGDGHHQPDPEAGERIYSSQVVWDETMAETASNWLAGDPARRVMIIAGNGHCHDSAIVRRIHRRGEQSAISIQPIVDDGDGNVASALAEGINDYLFVMTAE
jgi:uncharacterized iron-regulated protein